MPSTVRGIRGKNCQDRLSRVSLMKLTFRETYLIISRMTGTGTWKTEFTKAFMQGTTEADSIKIT